MKKIFVFFVFFQILLITSCAFAQEARIVDLKGQVFVKLKRTLMWRKAKLDMLLKKQAEIKTKKDSQCTLAFDDELKNILTIKENSRIKIESLSPAGEFSLPKGRVFSLIEDIAGLEKFEIKTPTAVAGVRGTGWSMDSQKSGTSVSCFGDYVYIQGLDEEGNVTGEQDLPEGFGIDINPAGILGALFELSDEDVAEWNENRRNFEDIRETIELENIDDFDEVDDLRYDQLDEMLEQRETFDDIQQQPQQDPEERY